MTRFTIGLVLVSAVLGHASPNWAAALELSAGNRGLSRFFTHAWLPARGTGIALADLYLLLLFGGVVEEALGALGYVGLYLSAGALGGFLSLQFLPDEPVRGFTAAVVAMSSYFCLSFPNARIGFRFGLPGRRSPLDSWIRLPPLVWLAFWFCLHLGMRLVAIDGLPEKSDFFYLAGPWVGGAIVGAVAWLVCLLTAPGQSD
jgi:membrane associated rhomboid family serine protease